MYKHFTVGSMKRIAKGVDMEYQDPEETREDVYALIFSGLGRMEDVFLKPAWEIIEREIDETIRNITNRFNEDFDNQIANIEDDLVSNGYDLGDIASVVAPLKEQYMMEFTTHIKKTLENWVSTEYLMSDYKDRIAEAILSRI